MQSACVAFWRIRVCCWMAVKVPENRVHAHTLGLLGFLISAGEHCTICTAQNTVEEEEVEEKRREKEKRDHSYSQIVALAPVLSSDLPLCFQFHIHMQKSSLGNLTFLPSPLSLPLFPSSLFLASLLHSLHLIPSCSQFAFSISKLFEASTSHRIPIPLPQDWTLGLLTFLSPLYISPYCVINPPALPPNLALPISLSFFFYWLYCSCLKNWFLDRGEVNLLWPCWASPSLHFWLF